MTDIKSLGYIRVQTNDIDRWRTFAFGLVRPVRSRHQGWTRH
ncbi:hypothetical protein [Mycobacterium sp. URHB0021]